MYICCVFFAGWVYLTYHRNQEFKPPSSRTNIREKTITASAHQSSLMPP